MTSTAQDSASLLRGPYLQLGTPNSVIIKWRTDLPVESIVVYGTEVDHLHLIAGDLDPTTEHEVKLADLSPQTRYFYGLEVIEGGLASGPDYFFITAPTNPQPTRIWVIGDSGTANQDAAAVRDAFQSFAGSRYTDLWLMLGDNAYGVGTDDEYQRAVFDMYPTLLHQTVLWSTIGNHETYSVPWGERFPYLDIFTLPEHGEAGGLPSGTERYYSFEYGDVHFVCLDAMTSDRTSAGPMLTWLQADLASQTKQWIIAFWHHPPYTKGSHDSDWETELIEMRQNAVPILEAYGTDLVLCGHSHIYERSFLLNGHYGSAGTLLPSMVKDEGSGRPDDTGPYLKGTSGPSSREGTIYAVVGCSGQATFRTGHHPAMFMDELNLGSLVLDIDGNRLDAKFLRESGAIDDYFSIIKDVPAEPLRIMKFALRDGKYVARWKSLPGQIYQIWHANTPEGSEWTPITNPIVATGATTSWADWIPFAGASGFYRIQVVTNPP